MVVKTRFRASPPTADRIFPQAKPFAALPEKKSRRALLSSPIPHLATGDRDPACTTPRCGWLCGGGCPGWMSHTPPLLVPGG
jgi:hypothetical protein